MRESIRVKLGEILEIDTADIRPMPGQPRKRFDRLELERLVLSIKRIGQRRPITVRACDSNQYELIDGERRYRACKQLQIPVKAWVKPVRDSKDQFLESVVSNFCAAPHDELETYEAIIRIRDENNYSIEQIADVFGKSAQWVGLYVSLGRLKPAILSMLSRELPDHKRLTFSNAVEIARLPEAKQEAIARKAVQEQLGLGQVKHLCRAAVAGIAERPRRTHHELEKYQNFLAKTTRDLEVLLLEKPDYYRQLFGSVDTFRRDELMDQLTGVIDDLKALREMLVKHVWKPNAATAAVS